MLLLVATPCKKAGPNFHSGSVASKDASAGTMGAGPPGGVTLGCHGVDVGGLRAVIASATTCCPYVYLLTVHAPTHRTGVRHGRPARRPAAMIAAKLQVVDVNLPTEPAIITLILS